MNAQQVAEYQAETRKRCAPSANDPDAKRTVCYDCGDVFWQRVGKYKRHCPDCAASRSLGAMTSMRLKRGPAYEGWVRKTYRNAKAEMDRLGLTPGD